MSYCSKCGQKNEDDAKFCSKCGSSLTHPINAGYQDDDCVCSENSRNPMVPVFWGIVVILIGLWIAITYVFPSYKPAFLQEFTCWGLILLIVAIAIILTGIRIMTK